MAKCDGTRPGRGGKAPDRNFIAVEVCRRAGGRASTDADIAEAEGGRGCPRRVGDCDRWHSNRDTVADRKLGEGDRGNGNDADRGEQRRNAVRAKTAETQILAPDSKRTMGKAKNSKETPAKGVTETATNPVRCEPIFSVAANDVVHLHPTSPYWRRATVQRSDALPTRTTASMPATLTRIRDTECRLTLTPLPHAIQVV